MRAFLVFSILAAHAAASPCDPKCDPKAKAKAKAAAAVVVGDPAVKIRTANAKPSCCAAASVSCASPSGTSTVCNGVASTTSSAGGAWLAGQTSVGQGSCAGASSCTSTTVEVAAAGPNLTAILARSPIRVSRAEPIVVSVDPEAQSLSGLAQVIRGARAYGQGLQGLDEETRESVRVRIESAHEAAREARTEAAESTRAAMEDARAAQRSAHEEARAAHGDARAAHDEARAAQREAAAGMREAMREAQEAQMEAEREYAAGMDEARRENPEAFATLDPNEMRELTTEAMASARKALEGAWAGIDLPEGLMAFDAAEESDAPESEDLEDRVRALEDMARAKGHATMDGSLEERVAALEEALAGGRKSRSARPATRAPRAYRYEHSDGQGLRGFTIDDDGQPRAFKFPRGTMRFAPVAPVAPVAPISPVAPVAPVAPHAPFTRSPAPSRSWSGPAAPLPMAPREISDDRRAIEDAMRSLRDEAEALREELMRMREQMESLPRKSDR